jgi:Putative beta-lactamase-inhibitor-like, PepSY-like
MKRLTRVFVAAVVVALALTMAGPSAWAGQKAAATPAQGKVELPPAVAKALSVNCPGAEIDKLTVEKDAGIVLYDIEFKAGRGEIEVAEDGTVMDIATMVAMKDVPKPAAEAIHKAAAGATVGQVEKSEVRAEIKKDGEKGAIVKLAAPKYVYEAELVKGEVKGEIQVAPDGQVVEGPKWAKEEAEEKEEMAEKAEAEEKEEAEEAAEVKAAAGVDLKILPPAVLEAFQKAYPKAVIKGASKETEKGVTYYEVESLDGKMNRDLLYTADGKAVEVEEAVAPGALPPAVLQALAKAYPGYKILKAEDMTKDGQKLFELQIQVKDKKIGVTIDPSGKIIQ